MSAKTRMTASWIAQAMAANPCKQLIGEDGKPNGLYRSCPVRLGWPNIFKPGKADEGKEPKYGAAVLFPMGADIAILQNAAAQKAVEAFPDKIVGGQFVGLHFPFRNQAEKANLEGYEPGAFFFNASTKFKPQCMGFINGVLSPIVDESKVYPGVWAILTMNVYSFADVRKKGVSFGLANVLLIADDERFGGGASDPHKDFAGVAVDATTDFSAAMAALPAVMPGGVAAPAIMPSTYVMPALPAAGLPVPGLPAPDVNDLM